VSQLFFSSSPGPWGIWARPLKCKEMVVNRLGLHGGLHLTGEDIHDTERAGGGAATNPTLGVYWEGPQQLSEQTGTWTDKQSLSRKKR
jgi:hypothetical protein